MDLWYTICITDNRYICFIQQIHFPFIVLLKLITLCLLIVYTFKTLLFGAIVNHRKNIGSSAPNAGTLQFGFWNKTEFQTTNKSEWIYINNKRVLIIKLMMIKLNKITLYAFNYLLIQDDVTLHWIFTDQRYHFWLMRFNYRFSGV